MKKDRTDILKRTFSFSSRVFVSTHSVSLITGSKWGSASSSWLAMRSGERNGGIKAHSWSQGVLFFGHAINLILVVCKIAVAN